MAYIIAPRRGKSSRMKKKALTNDGEESCLKISPIATQWSGLPFAAVKADSKRHEASQSNFQLQSFLDTFPNEIEESERSILRKIEEAWQRKDVDTMFQLIKVSSQYNMYFICTELLWRKLFHPRTFTFHLLPNVFHLASESWASYTFVEGKPLH